MVFNTYSLDFLEVVHEVKLLTSSTLLSSLSFED